MDSRVTVGITFMLIISFLLAGTYSALMPTQLEIVLKNFDTASCEVHLVLTKDGGTVKSWRLQVESGRTRTLQFPVDIGSFRLIASLQGSANVTSDFEIPFKFLDKSHSETFTVTPAGLFKGNIY